MVQLAILENNRPGSGTAPQLAALADFFSGFWGDFSGGIYIYIYMSRGENCVLNAFWLLTTEEPVYLCDYRKSGSNIDDNPSNGASRRLPRAGTRCS